MYDLDKRLFVGVKISTKLQNELDHCARDTERYFKEDKVEYLQVVTLGEERLIGRFLQDGFQCQPQYPQHRPTRSATIPGRGRLHSDLR